MCTCQKLTCFGSATKCNGPHSQKSGCGRLRQVKAGVGGKAGIGDSDEYWRGYCVSQLCNGTMPW